MKTFTITITPREGRPTQITGLFSCSIDAVIAGMDIAQDPHSKITAVKS